MWICLNNAFFSIVTPARNAPADGPLLVRARRKGDIEAVFGVPGVASPGRDYAYRATLERDVVASVLMCQVLGIQYDNFKNSVKDDKLHGAYASVWSIMGRLQVGGPYGRMAQAKPRHAVHNYGPREAARQLGFGTVPEWPTSPAEQARLADGDRNPGY